ncbi:hypothetical protein PP175_12170 [Aneurinibacillus sp. Ricciae_BoGa-3]|uniref:hypothetical protein n=1 Tax=Aneurinibacillus sp. Ricciae_BoGa-3 TaxID=3022697 RepID=UPI0023405A74|nr:hypothetical protein [Aneurinibacillus sp. Ricciae_BoGa-3]WCK56595.1 hypothetical protein PP175_12170 [Aneurinibacillus sp. Ricciae_BoGa-3]
MWAVLSLVGLLGMFVFGILAMVASLRNKPAITYYKVTLISFVVLIISLIYYKR